VDSKDRDESLMNNCSIARPLAAVALLLALSAARSGALAAECNGNPDALGTGRTIVVDPTEHGRIGTMQYPETLPLRDHEVVLTFDDGPLPPNTTKVLDTLASQCVKATFFIVGRMAHAYPSVLRRAQREGHSIGIRCMLSGWFWVWVPTVWPALRTLRTPSGLALA